MRKEIICVLTLLVCVFPATATTGFDFNKYVEVRGDWEWTGSWEKTYPATATYDYEVNSSEATESDVINSDNIGEPWKWEGHSRVETNSETDYTNNFHAWTVNDPETTPSTGGYTSYDFHEHTKSTNKDSESFVDLAASGHGETWITSHVHTEHESYQQVDTNIN